MSDDGWVFVTQGKLQEIHCDIALVPTDGVGMVEDTWGRFQAVPAARRAVGADGVSEPTTVADGQLVRYVDVGFGPRHQSLDLRTARALVGGLRERVQAALLAAGSDAAAMGSSQRERPLVAVPVFGSGAGGFDLIRGEVVGMLLELTAQAVTTYRYDVAIVCYSRADLTAVQHHREPPDQLPEGVSNTARSLGRAAAQHRLVLFLGAGVSIAAGLPDFARLIRDAAAQIEPVTLTVTPTSPEEAAAAASVLKTELGEGGVRDRLRKELTRERHALLHSTLAALRVEEVITTNFDDLYEKSSAHQPGGVVVLPWQRDHARTAWVLKVHGDLQHDETPLRLTEQELREGNTALNAVTTASMLTSQVLFVGYSGADPDYQLAAADVLKELPAGQKLGWSLWLDPPTEVAGREPASTAGVELIRLHCEGDDGIGAAARRCEIFCDVMLWEATRGELAWALDPRYEALARPDDLQLIEQLRTVDPTGSPLGRTVAEFLARIGRPA